MKIEVGKVYRCGDGYVCIVANTKNFDFIDSHAYKTYVGVGCGVNGNQNSCETGMFNDNGSYTTDNVPALCYDLQPLKTPQQIKLEELEQTIKNAQEQIKQLKEEI